MNSQTRLPPNCLPSTRFRNTPATAPTLAGRLLKRTVLLYVITSSIAFGADASFLVRAKNTDFKEAPAYVTISKLNQKLTLYKNGVIIINDKPCPVQITDSTVMHVNAEVASKVQELWKTISGFLDSEEILALAELKQERIHITVSASGEAADAVKFGVVMFDSFKEFLGSMTAVIMDQPNADMLWNFTPSYAFKFKRFGVMVVYVKQVRTKSGAIWNCDSSKLALEISKQYSAVSKASLEKEDSAK